MEDLNLSWPQPSDDDQSGIFFVSHEVDFDLDQKDKVKLWVNQTITAESYALTRLDVIFCSDDFLLQINRDHLNHDYYTDIITFPLNANPILAELYISIDRVKENAAALKLSFETELHRVIIHGVLHLCGYDDHEEEDIKLIRSKEELYLLQLNRL